jgi:hypothetical protein
VNIPSVSSNANLAAMQQQQQQELQGLGAQSHHARSTSDVGMLSSTGQSMASQQQQQQHPPTVGNSSRSTSAHLLAMLKQPHQQQPQSSSTPLQAVSVTRSLPRTEMTLLPPVMQHR